MDPAGQADSSESLAFPDTLPPPPQSVTQQTDVSDSVSLVTARLPPPLESPTEQLQSSETISTHLDLPSPPPPLRSQNLVSTNLLHASISNSDGIIASRSLSQVPQQTHSVSSPVLCILKQTLSSSSISQNEPKSNTNATNKDIEIANETKVLEVNDAEEKVNVLPKSDTDLNLPRSSPMLEPELMPITTEPKNQSISVISETEEFMNQSQLRPATAPLLNRQSQSSSASPKGKPTPDARRRFNSIFSSYNVEFRKTFKAESNDSKKISSTSTSIPPVIATAAIVEAPTCGKSSMLRRNSVSTMSRTHSVRRNAQREESEIANENTPEFCTSADQLVARARRLRLKVENKRSKESYLRRRFNNIRARITFSLRDSKWNNIGLWSNSVKKIEGRFGAGIASYFELLRFVVHLNILLSVVWFCCVIFFGMASLQDPLIVNQKPTNQTIMSDLKTKFLDDGWASAAQFFAGTGAWQDTPLFYASYQPLMMQQIVPMDIIYILTTLFTLSFSLIFVIRKIRMEYIRKTSFYIGVGIDQRYPFSVAVFGSWKHSIDLRSSRENMSTAVTTVLRTLIEKQELKRTAKATSLADFVIRLVLKVIMNMVAAALLVLSGLAVYDSVRACDSAINTTLFSMMDLIYHLPGGWQKFYCAGPSRISPFPPYIVSFFNAVLPPIFSAIAEAEMYNDPQWKIRIVIIRTYLVKIATIYILIFSLNAIVQLNIDLQNNFVGCWEHQIAIRFYSLLWLEAGTTISMTVLVALIRKLLFLHFELDLPSSILELVYRQAIVWIGSVYAPGLPIIAIGTNAAVFYTKKWVMQIFAIPPKRIYSTHAQLMWFLFFMLATLILMAIPALYALSYVHPSTTCGPYRPMAARNITFGRLEGATTLIPKYIEQLSDDSPVGQALTLLGSIVVLGPALALVLLWLYVMHAVAKKRGDKLNELQRDLEQERENKKIIVRQFGIRT